MNHPTAPTKLSQTDLIERKLLAAHGKWVSLPDLHKASGAYAVHSRACDVRRRGHTVENRKKTHPITKVVESYYRIPQPEQPELL